MNRPSDVEKLSSDKRLAWRALSTLGTQLLLIPNGHTLTKGPTVALGMLSNHADLLHSYCGGDGCICMEYVLNLTWTEGAPS